MRDAGVQAATSEREAEALWEDRIGHVQRAQARGEAAMSELHGRLMAARLEVEASTQRAEQLSVQLRTASGLANETRREVHSASGFQPSGACERRAEPRHARVKCSTRPGLSMSPRAARFIQE